VQSNLDKVSIRWRNLQMRIRVMRHTRRNGFEMYLRYLQGKSGLEIGGPSYIFQKGNVLPIYEVLENLDNCVFSNSTVWTNHDETFVFHPQKAPGKTIICDGSMLADVPDSTYDVILSSHNLEHFANPVKALKEWQRVLKANGILTLVLPYYRATFDHRREPTPVEHMLEDFERDTGEDDLTHLPEILDKHDLAMDHAAGTLDQFRNRSLDNINNRCLHHHVFDERNSRELLSRLGFEVVAFDLQLPFHMCLLARFPKTSQ
jgi:SAM-dependent methyltransferase